MRVSYWPAVPKEGQVGGVPVQNAGEVLVRMVIYVTRAAAGVAQVVKVRAAAMETAAHNRFPIGRLVMSELSAFPRHGRVPRCG